MTGEHDIEDEMAEEFWLFLDNAPLPGLGEIAAAMQKPYPNFKVSTGGNIESLKDNMVNGLVIDAEDAGSNQAAGIPVAWMVEVLDPRRFFSGNARILRDLGNKTKMLRMVLCDEYSLGHVLAMLHALLSMRDGVLAIPSDEGDIMVFNQQEAIAVLEEELEEIQVDVDYEDE